MSETKHTPGPWQIEKRSDGNVEVQDDEGSPLAEFFGEDGDSECWPVTANATLAAAAPELLEALKEAVRELECHTRSDMGDVRSAETDAVAAGLAAIAKAEGR